ncbi:TetR/AcrR family transcriptional regulator [Flectobacillus longus]|uniref:TetR/AcrR family transcriptional regulator n=1 Tax=Flectobacillus longus TaxID=2984207 RepID=A0ABT6YSW7_9BACT|nr:TetR/AcrR family transcriptional regulator [Flectobacillus longus]MDI9866693.1 TetR/AcrR family transcriptional regulator [Flectobacillus longus]MDI9881462.1 TetR/AcrR family transcriptional regulator [Flectobacillus longus]
MGILERKEREKLELKQRILEAAKEIFIKEGFDKASIRAIADKIEYSPATIYLHYKDKDELFYAVHELGFDKLSEMTRPVEAIEDAFEQLRIRGLTYLKFAFENPELYDLMFIKDAPMHALKKQEAGWDCGMHNFVALQKNLALCIEQGSVLPADIDVLSMSIWSYVHGLVSLNIRGRFDPFCELNPEIQLEKLIGESLDFMLNLIKKKNE